MSNPDVVGTTLSTYLTRVAAVELLTPEEEVDLAKRAAAGVAARQQLASGTPADARRRDRLRKVAADGERAADLLVRANLRLVVAMARPYQGRGLELPDLVQEGNLGLMRAVERFDHTRGFRFSTYAAWWIRQAITRGLAERSRAMRLPVHAHELLVKLRWVELDQWQRSGREPTEAELAERLGIRVGRLREIRAAAADLASLDAPVSADGDATVGTLVPDGTAPDPAHVAVTGDVRAVVSAAVGRLEGRERHVLEQRYGLRGDEPRTLDEIGRDLGVTRERVRQIEIRALRKLAHHRLGGLLDALTA